MAKVVEMAAYAKVASRTRVASMASAAVAEIKARSAEAEASEAKRAFARQGAEIRVRLRAFAVTAIELGETEWARRMIETEAREIVDSLRCKEDL